MVSEKKHNVEIHKIELDSSLCQRHNYQRVAADSSAQDKNSCSKIKRPFLPPRRMARAYTGFICILPPKHFARFSPRIGNCGRLLSLFLICNTSRVRRGAVSLRGIVIPSFRGGPTGGPRQEVSRAPSPPGTG